jgi:hypothetical protein
LTSDNGPTTLSIAKATLTGNATTQDALNMAKQGKLTITIGNVASLVTGDTLAAVLTTAEFYLTVGTNRYDFFPMAVTTSGSSIRITFSLKTPPWRPNWRPSWPTTHPRPRRSAPGSGWSRRTTRWPTTTLPDCSRPRSEFDLPIAAWSPGQSAPENLRDMTDCSEFR